MKVKNTVTDPNTGFKQEVEVDAQKDEIIEFARRLVPDFAKDLVGIVSDNVKLWRFTNQLRILKQAKEKIEKSGLNPQTVPLKILVPLIEKSSLEEEPAMQAKWAAMLANASTGQVDVKAVYVELLKELSGIEVLLLDLIFEEALREQDYQKRKQLQFSKEKIMEILKIDNENADLIIENLFRLNILQSPGSRGASLGSYPFAIRTTEIFELTTLGYNFIKSMKFN